ncbi:uncharacterized protein [Battus philenor]|uniref:uncharacterized protein n=1 Tax=Battus philenor TaxID=42288 RepID=UPI0035CE9291
MIEEQEKRRFAVINTNWIIEEVFNEGNRLKLRVEIKRGRKSFYISKHSETYIINNVVSFQMRLDGTEFYRDMKIGSASETAKSRLADVLLFCKFDKVRPETKAYASVVCNDLDVRKTFFTDETWRYLCDKRMKLNFDITINVGLIEQMFKPFEMLYDSTDSGDLKLLAEDGSVKLHSAVLAAYSPVLKKELRDKAQLQHKTLLIPDVKQLTLQLLKDYMYLKNIPNTLAHLKDLLIIGYTYKISELYQMCMEKVVTHVTAENVYALTEFAQRNKLVDLYLRILDLIHNGLIKTEDIKKYFE